MERVEARPRVPIVALTASTTPVDLERCLAAGMDGRVSKPIDPRLLLGELSRRTGRTQPNGRTASVFPARPPLERALQRLQGNRELLGRIVGQFKLEAARARDLLDAALDERDAPGLLFVAHRLRGQAASVDAQLVVDALEQVEAATRAGSWPDVEEALALMSSELDLFLGGVGSRA
jgi:HPt (histidine-containing phosphotransfer) domain-containing protein